MVPLVYFIITMGQLQGGAFAVVGAADQAAKVFVAQADAAGGRAAAEQAVLLALADHGHSAARRPGRNQLCPGRLHGRRLGRDGHCPSHGAVAVRPVQRGTQPERRTAQRLRHATGGPLPMSRPPKQRPGGARGRTGHGSATPGPAQRRRATDGADHRLRAARPAAGDRRHRRLERLHRAQEAPVAGRRSLGGRRGQLHAGTA